MDLVDGEVRRAGPVRAGVDATRGGSFDLGPDAPTGSSDETARPAERSVLRDVLLVPDLVTPQAVWHEWRALFEKAGYRALAPEISSGGKPEHFVERTTEQMLELIDEMTLEPHLIGVGHGALVALCVADERSPGPARDRAARGAGDGAAIGVVAIGGPAIPLDQLGVRAGTGRSHPLLLVGGEDDPELPVDAMLSRHAAYLSGAESRVELILGPGTARSLAFGPGWRRTSAMAVAFCNRMTREERASAASRQSTRLIAGSTLR